MDRYTNTGSSYSSVSTIGAATCTGTATLEVGDINRDGIQDVALACNSNGRIAFTLGQ